MRRFAFSYIFFLIGFTSCVAQSSYKTNSVIAANLVKVCVDATLKLDPGLNGRDHHYLVDFNKVPDVQPKGIADFLKLNRFGKKTNLDSLFKYDKQWLREQYFDHPVIRFEQIEALSNGDLIINTSKFWSSDGAIGTEIILHLNGNQFTVVKSRITWTS